MQFMLFRTRGTAVRWATLVCCAAMLSFATKAHPQLAGTGNIQGTVTDSSGAIIVAASVVATDDATGVKHTAMTDASGLYSFPNLAIGKYSVEVTAKGFSSYRQSGIVLDVGSSIAVNVSMKIGQESTTVQVQANALALQTEDVSLKQTVDQSTILDMPLNGRQVSSLITAAGGAVNANSNSDVTGSKNFQTAYEVSIAGGQGNMTDNRLDGGDNNNYQTNTGLALPFPDAVAQFSVETAALDATSGLHPGGLVNVVTRSGSNQWHGSAFEFIRNNAIDATNFFSVTKDTLHQNQFGGTFGGRIIPNKLFFFGGYQHLKADQSQASTTSYVPTAANLKGDFSQSDPINTTTGANQLVDPITGILLVNNMYSDTPGVTWSPNASALMLDKYLPPTTAANGLVTYAIPSQASENQIVTRVDATINSKNSLYGRYFLDGYTTPAFYSATNILLTTQPGNYERNQSFTLGETYTISQSMVNSFHATFARLRNDRGPNPTGINASNINVSVSSLSSIGLELSASNKWSSYCGTCMQAFFNSNAFSFIDDVNWIHGKHQIGFGGEYVRAQFNSSNVFEGNGDFGFSGLYSEKGPTGSGKIGTAEDSNLDFLTGALNTFGQSKAQQNALRAPIPSLYIMDTYHVSHKIVLSAGIRWDPEYFPTDYFGRGGVFNNNDFVNNVHSTVYPLAPAGSLFFGDPGVPKSFTKNSPWQFSPRLGITFDPSGTGKMVIRAGAALVYDEPNFFTAERQQDNSPYGLTINNTAGNVPLNFSAPWSNGSVTPNPFPLPFKPAANSAFPLGTQFIGLPAQFHSPYMLQWTASVERQFGRGWQFQVDYIGNKTAFNPVGDPISQAVYIPGNWGAGGTGCAPIATTGPSAVKPGAAGTACSTTGNEASRFALTIANPTQGPYYAGGGSSVIVLPAANSSYNGAVFTLQHRLSSSFVLLADYTWSHCIDISDAGGDTSGASLQNIYNINGDKGSCGFDYRDVVNTTVVASSHFHFNRLWNQVVNNWEISPLVRIEDGTPFTVHSGIDNSLTDIGDDRPDLTNASEVYTHATIRSGPSTNAQYINKTAFTQNATGAFGDVGRNAFRGPKFLQTDLALNRSFPLREALSLNFRLEAFNVLNHPDFVPPGSSGYIGSSTSLTSSTFGQVTSTVNGYGARIFQGAIKLTF